MAFLQPPGLLVEELLSPASCSQSKVLSAWWLSPWDGFECLIWGIYPVFCAPLVSQWDG